MKRSSGIRFLDSKFLNDFENQVKEQSATEKASLIFNYYSVHKCGNGVILEFTDLSMVGLFLEKAREIGISGSSFRIVKLFSCIPTDAYKNPIVEKDKWAASQIKKYAYKSNIDKQLLFRKDDYRKLEQDLKLASVDISHYLA